MYLENSPRIALYNANPITLLGRGIQCIYEGSFAWLAIATHPLFAGDYCMEEDDYPDLLPQSLPVPSSQIPYEQKSVAVPVVASNSPTGPPPTFDPPLYVAPTPSVISVVPLSPVPLAATETNVATLTLTNPDVAGPLEQAEKISGHETEHPQCDDPAFLQYWRTSTTKDSHCVPVIHDVTERTDAVDISTPSTPPALSTCPSGTSTLPPHLPDYEDEAQTPHDEPVQLLTLPNPPLEHAPWPDESKHYLSPLKSRAVLPVDLYPPSERRKRRSRHSVHILEPEPRQRTKRHLYEEKTLEQPEEGRHSPLAYQPAVSFHSEHSNVHPYHHHHHHHHHHGRHRRSRRKDRIHDRAELDPSLEVLFERRHESSPPDHLAQSYTAHPLYTELPSEHYHRHHRVSRREEETHDRAGTDADLEGPSLDRFDESHPPTDRLARPSTPHPRHMKLPSVTEERFYVEADEFLDSMAEQLFQAENTLRNLKREKRHGTQAGNSAHDTQAKDRKERRRRSAPYASRPVTRSTSAYEYREPSPERKRSKTKKIRGATGSRKTKKRGTSPLVDDIGTLGLGTLSLAQPRSTYADTSAHLLQSSAVPRSLNSRLVARSGPNASQPAGALQPGSSVAALPMVQQQLDDGELSILLQSVRLGVGSEPSEHQHQNEVPPSIDVNQQWTNIEDLSNTLTQVQLKNEVPEQEQPRPLTIRIPSMAQLHARIVARNTTVVKTSPTSPPID